jgi:hypothetical protein
MIKLGGISNLAEADQASRDGRLRKVEGLGASVKRRSRARP